MSASNEIAHPLPQSLSEAHAIISHHQYLLIAFGMPLQEAMMDSIRFLDLGHLQKLIAHLDRLLLFGEQECSRFPPCQMKAIMMATALPGWLRPENAPPANHKNID